MVEVFRTNVQDGDHARMLVHHIHESFGHYQVNFDLDDCDRILRVKCNDGSVEPENVIELLRDFGFNAEVLPDSPAVETRMSKMIRQCGALYFFHPYHAQ
jgi:hypothetical protein